ncbi:MAG: RNA polymerase sigma factor RpoD/SigA [Spirochaetales bacterium]|jgi:RNA polymerase primary sigma factor|nr:RNA polymerase sigma factor RpoD/SigA [Spirochaetales bacterium]
MDFASFSKELSSIPLLSREEEVICARKAAAGDLAARNQLIIANLRFVVSLARKYSYAGIPAEDLIDEGCIGLIQAIKRYDPEKGYHFLSYAVWWIRQAMLKSITQNGRLIRLPSHKVKELAQLERLKHDGLMERGNEPDSVFLASQLHEDRKGMTELLTLAQKIVSLDTPSDTSQSVAPLSELLADKRQVSIDDAVVKECLRADIEKLLGRFTDREAAILKDRFGLDGTDPKSLEEVGRKFKLTKERIRQIEQRALRKLRYSADSERLRSYLQ